MPIYELSSGNIVPLRQATFREVEVRERQDLQRALRERIEVVSPDTLVIAEEFGQWDESRRRIDLLGIDKQANLVVIELKRTEDGGHMELQAIRYAAMVSVMTFEQVVEVYGEYLESIGRDEDPSVNILEFLEWEEADEEAFAQDVRIVLASAEFSKELTTSVIWLNGRGLDIRCVRLRPYADGERVLLDVQQVIPLPEAEEYQIKMREKTRKERASRVQGRDFTKYDVTVGDASYRALSKRESVFRTVKHFCEHGVTPDQITASVNFRRTNWCRLIDLEVASEKDFIRHAIEKADALGRSFNPERYYTADEELIRSNGRTYAVSNQWGRRSAEWIEQLIAAFPHIPASILPHDEG